MTILAYLISELIAPFVQRYRLRRLYGTRKRRVSSFVQANVGSFDAMNE